MICYRGVGKACNEGVRVASGQLLLFLDADTYLESNFVSEMYHAFNDPRVVCMSGVLKNLEKLAPLDNLFAVSHYEFLNKLASISARLGFPMFASVCCAARKDAFLKVGGFAEDIACGEDVTLSRKWAKLRVLLTLKPQHIHLYGESVTAVKSKCTLCTKNYVKLFRQTKTLGARLPAYQHNRSIMPQLSFFPYKPQTIYYSSLIK